MYEWRCTAGNNELTTNIRTKIPWQQTSCKIYPSFTVRVNLAVIPDVAPEVTWIKQLQASGLITPARKTNLLLLLLALQEEPRVWPHTQTYLRESLQYAELQSLVGIAVVQI